MSAEAVNPSLSLNSKTIKQPKRTPRRILKSKVRLSKAHSRVASHKSSLHHQQLAKAKKNYQNAVRKARLQQCVDHDTKMSSIVTSKPQAVYKYIKSIRKTKTTTIDKLTVGDKVYTGPRVPDGFYDSMTALKSCDFEQLKADTNLKENFSNYEHILRLCKDNHTITEAKSTKILKRMKKDVIDFFSITALHYLHAGEEGIVHLTAVLNSVITEVNNATIEELNVAYGLILYKGHSKDKTRDSSYRTISTCPFLAKALDLYLRDLYQDLWNASTATTQYQAAGSSHELASLLVTELIQYSLFVLNLPLYLLVLAAQSAFDRCLRQILCCELFRVGMSGTALLLIDNRLANRSTVYEWDGSMMGPAADDTGFEQGGINSGDYYKHYNNEQVKTAQSSNLGVNIASSVVSGIADAYDVIFSAINVDNLGLLARLTESYCAKFRVKLVPSKTKLLPIYKKEHQVLVDYAELVNPVKINGEKVEFVTEAEHVGVLRSVSGNIPNILQQILAYKRALGSVSSAGLARAHRTNPAASLRVHQLYCTPVLLSGLASLVLSKSEISLIENHFK